MNHFFKTPKTEMTATASVQENKLKKPQEVKNERFLIWTRENNVPFWGIYVSLTKRQMDHGQTLTD